MKTHNKFLQSDQIMLSCLLQKAQKPRQHALAAEEKRYICKPTAVQAEQNYEKEI